MNKLNLSIRYFILAMQSVLLSSCSLIMGEEPKIETIVRTPEKIVEIYPSSYPEFTYKKKNNKGISVYINSKEKTDHLDRETVLRLGSLDNYAFIMPSSEPSLDNLYAAYVKKAFDEAGFNVVDKPRKTSIIVDVIPGKLNIGYSNYSKTGMKVRNELYLKLEQESANYSYHLDCRFGGSEIGISLSEKRILHRDKAKEDAEYYYPFSVENIGQNNLPYSEILRNSVDEVLKQHIHKRYTDLVGKLKYLKNELNKANKIQFNHLLDKFYGGHDKDGCRFDGIGYTVIDPAENRELEKWRRYEEKYVKEYDVRDEQGRFIEHCRYDSYREELTCRK